MSKIMRSRATGKMYTVIGNASAHVATTPIEHGQRLIIHRSADVRLFAQRSDEFHDGRFEDVTPKRLWWPAAYSDEVMPEGTFAPDDWILARHNEAWVLAPKDREDARNYGIMLVRNGDVVEFTWNEPRGRDQMLVYPDGSWSLESGEPEDWTDVFDADEFENSGSSLDDFARDNRDLHDLKDGDEPIGIDVIFVKWGDTRFRFSCIGDAARFEAADESDTAKGQEADARGDMGSGDRAGGTPLSHDWTVDDSRTAGAILSYLGIGSDASLEPGADRRRDKVAAIICAAHPFDLARHLHRQKAFSERTFGPGARTNGVIDHIRKELREIKADPTDIMEWVDVIILAFDGAWRAGWEPDAIITALVEKQTRNEARTWPDWRTADPNAAIEHVRTGKGA